MLLLDHFKWYVANEIKIKDSKYKMQLEEIINCLL